jgi:hypothetical protein
LEGDGRGRHKAHPVDGHRLTRRRRRTTLTRRKAVYGARTIAFSTPSRRGNGKRDHDGKWTI